MSSLTSEHAQKQNENRLSHDVVPSHYRLTISSDLKAKTFSGTCEITLDVLKTTPAITLNAASPLVIRAAVLAPISSGDVLSDAGRWQEAKAIEVDTKRERAKITFTGADVKPGTYRLGIRWEGLLNRSMKGYYLSAYPDAENGGQEAFYAVTQFQPTAARRAFPCFDEPHLKATYDISMISRANTVSLSNMDVLGIEQLGTSPTFPRTELLNDSFFSRNLNPNTPSVSISSTATDKWEVVHFRTSPKISTYLVAWANGDFKYREASYTSTSGKVIPLRMYATSEVVAQTAYSLEVTKTILPIYENSFSIPFPLSKIDTLVVHDFDLGAMENWGLIMGRTSVYLLDEKKSGLAAKRHVAGVTSHEISHQWFGNITTIAWWDCLYLNEAFATLVGEMVMMEKFEPKWQASANFISDHLARALNLDAARSSHPIEQPCPDEGTILSIFDAISYSKGASVLKSLISMVGEEVFFRGVTIYLKAHLYGSAQSDDLWKGISEASGQDISKIMHSWTTKIGFPVVTVEETDQGLKLRQNRFLNTADPSPEEDETIWHIPLALETLVAGKVEVNRDAVLAERETTLDLPNIAETAYKLNYDTTGVYRVLYPPERLIKLGDEAGKKDSLFGLKDRMGLVQDAAVLAASGYSKTSTALTLLAKMSNETEALVWAEVSTALTKLAAAWWDQPEEDKDGLDKLRRTLFAPVAKRLGFEYRSNDSINATELRSLSISVAAACGDKELLDEYKRRFNMLVTSNDESGIPPDLRRSIFVQSVAKGGRKEYTKVLDIYRSPATPSHKSAAIAALCSTQESDLLDQTFTMLSSDEVKSQDYSAFVMGLASNSKGKRLMWSYFKKNYSTISKRFEGNFQGSNTWKAAFQTLSSEEDVKDIESFFKEHGASGYEAAVAQGLDAVRAQASWIKRDAQDVHEWLSTNGYLGSA